MDFDTQRHKWSAEFLDAVSASDLEGPTAQAERERLVGLVRHHVDHGPGFLIMTGLDQVGEPEYKTTLLWVSAALGAVLPQDRDGTIVRHVRDRGTAIGEGESARYADSRYGGHLHTDGAERPFPVPDYFTLLCVRAAKAGGSLRLVPVDHLRSGLSAQPELLSLLEQNFHFDRRGDQEPGEPRTTSKPVLFLSPHGKNAVTYLRRYIDVGHSHPDVERLTDDQRRALDTFDSLLDDPALAIEGRMAPGELAVFDNTRILHGRTEFKDDKRPDRARLLYRTWVQRTVTAGHVDGG